MWDEWETYFVDALHILQPTVSWPVCLGVVLLLGWVAKCYISLSNNYFFFICSWRAPSMTRRWVCNLQCNDASSISSYIVTNGLSASSSWCRAPFLCLTITFFQSQSYITIESQSASLSWCQVPIQDPQPICPKKNFLDSCGVVDVGRPLWREDGSVSCSAMMQVQFQVILQPTVCQPVRLGSRLPMGPVTRF
jgi:hypothetical protein